MELRDALTQISEIRQQMAQSQVFRGLPLGDHRVLGRRRAGGVGVQAWWFKFPRDRWENLGKGLYIWLAAAVLSLVVVGIEMAVRYRRSAAQLQREVTLLAVEQFVPCLVAGALMTYAMANYAGQSLSHAAGAVGDYCSAWASSPRGGCLPRGAFLVGAYYLLAGVLCIAMHGRPGGFPDPDGRHLRRRAVAGGGGVVLDVGAYTWQALRTTTPRRTAPPGRPALTAALSPPASRPARRRPTPPRPRAGSRRGQAGRYAYDGLQRVIHERLPPGHPFLARRPPRRPAVHRPQGPVQPDRREPEPAAPIAPGDWLRPGLKGFKNNRPQTLCQLTEAGRERFLEYIAVLENVVADAMAAPDFRVSRVAARFAGLVSPAYTGNPGPEGPGAGRPAVAGLHGGVRTRPAPATPDPHEPDSFRPASRRRRRAPGAPPAPPRTDRRPPT